MVAEKSRRAEKQSGETAVRKPNFIPRQLLSENINFCTFSLNYFQWYDSSENEYE